jgi:hypothetical protein
MTATHIKYLKSLKACDEAIEFASDYSTLSEAYAACTRPAWLFWLAGRTGVSRRDIVLAACACARTVIPFATRPEALIAIETAEAWCRAEPSTEQVSIDNSIDYADHAAHFAAGVHYAADYITHFVVAEFYDDNSFSAKVTMCDLIRAIIPCPEVVR